MSDDELSLSRIIAAFRARWKLLLALPLACAMIAGGTSYFITPSYRAQCVVSPAQPERLSGDGLARLAGQLGAFGGLVSELGGASDQSELWIATLRSRSALETFIRKYDLLPILFAKRWDAQNKKWRERNGRNDPPTMDDAIRRIRRDVLDINEDKRTGLITVAIDWHDRVRAAAWANDFVALVNEIARERTIDEARRSIVYLESELEATNVVERRQIIYRLIESRVNDIMLAKGRSDYAFAVVDPATTPDLDKPSRPRRLLMLILGLFVGGVVAGSITFLSVLSPRSN